MFVGGIQESQDTFLSLTATDGVFCAYSENEDEMGEVTYLTEGRLRALHRKASSDLAPSMMLVPYHSFKRRDASRWSLAK